MNNWDKKYMGLASHIAGWSKDPSRKVGCVIVGDGGAILATGYNGFPRGVDDTVTARYERPAKYSWTEHAERNAIYNAARCGCKLAGATMYMPWYPCVDCARGIIQSGIATLVCGKPDFNDPTWGKDFKLVNEMFDEVQLGGGLDVEYYEES